MLLVKLIQFVLHLLLPFFILDQLPQVSDKAIKLLLSYIAVAQFCKVVLDGA